MNPLPTFPDLGLLALRLFLGPIMMAHGFPKLFVGQARTQAIQGMKGMGVPAALTIIASLIELLGGLGLLLGLLARVAALFVVIEMVGTSALRKGRMKHTLIGGYELDISYAMLALGLLLLGPGSLSLDHLLGLA